MTIIIYILITIMAIIDISSKIIQPFPGGQENFLSRTEDEVLFGGVAGPGKSWCLVIDALGLQYESTKLGKKAIEVSKYQSVLFRRESNELATLTNEAHEYYPDFNGLYTGQRKGEPGPAYRFPDYTPGSTKEGAVIFFCHLKDEDDKRKHKGFEYQYIGFDELTQFTITQYSYLFSRARSSILNLDPRIRATTNWEGPGLWWVKKRFWKGLTASKTFHFIQEKELIDDPQGKQVKKGTKFATSRIFIPGKLEENPIYANDDKYRSAIMAMGPKYARALLHGDPDAFSGDFFEEFDSVGMMVDPFMIDPQWKIYASLDPGYSSPCSFGIRAVDLEGTVYRVATYYVRKQSPTQHAEGILNFITSLKWTGGRMPERIVSGHDAWAKKDRYAIIANEKTFADIFLQHGIYLTKAVIDRIPGWWAMKDLMARKKYKVFKILNESFVDELQSAVHDDVDEEDIKGRGNDINVQDHALDEERYGIMSVYKPMEKKDANIHPGTRAAVKKRKEGKSKWTKF